MKKSQSGFTLVELVVVIVLLGILGVTALGKFQDLSGDAAAAAVKGIAGELSSAAAINFKTSTLANGSATTIDFGTCDAAGVPSAFLNGLFASGEAPTTNLTYAFDASGDMAATGDACAAGQTYRCTITDSRAPAAPATAFIICTG